MGMFDKKIEVKESAKEMNGSIKECMEALCNKGGLETLRDMDPSTLVIIQASMKLVNNYAEMSLRQSEALDKLLEEVEDLNSKMKQMDSRLDGLTRKNITEK